MDKNEGKKIPLVAAIVLAVVTFGAGAAGGYVMAPKGAPARTGDNTQRAAFRQGGQVPQDGVARFRDGAAPAGMGGRFAAGMSMVSGDVMSVDGHTVTIGLEDGSSKVVVLTSDTQISELSVVEDDALEEGMRVFVTAEADETGNLIATMLQIRPEELGMFRGGMGIPPADR